MIETTQAHIWIGRELNAVGPPVRPGEVWDNRWELRPHVAPFTSEQTISALGLHGLSVCPTWRDTGVPRLLIAALPAVWQGDELIAAPLAGMPKNWQATHVYDPSAFLNPAISD